MYMYPEFELTELSNVKVKTEYRCLGRSVDEKEFMQDLVSHKVEEWTEGV